MRNGFKMAMAGLGAMTMAQGCGTTQTYELEGGHTATISEGPLGTHITTSDGSIDCFSKDPTSEAMRSCTQLVSSRLDRNAIEPGVHF